jgi:hypothetical protein
MRASRRSFLKTTALGAGAAVAAPYMFVRNIDQAWGAQSWIKKGEPIKIGLLFSLSGGLAVPEEDSTLVMQYAIDEINKAGGIDGIAKTQAKEKLAAAEAKFGKLPKEKKPKKPANDNYRPTVSWPLMDQLTRRTFEPDRERRTKLIVTARYLRELVDSVEADSLGLSVHLPGKSAPTDFDVQRTESGKVYFEHGQTLDRRKVIYDNKNGEANAERYSGSVRTAKKSLPVGNGGFDLPFPVRVLSAREELDAVVAAVGLHWPYLLLAIGAKFAKAFLALRAEHLEYLELVDKIDDADGNVSALRITPAGLSDPRDRCGNYAYGLREFAEAGFISHSVVPKVI